MGDWERRRAVIGLVEIARDALQTADAMLPDDESATASLKDAIYSCRIDIVKVLDALPPLAQWDRSAKATDR